MKTTKILLIWILVLGLIFSWTKVSEAAPLGTAFTYQGRLYDNNEVANGLYDFQFKLYDSNSGAIQLGNDVNQADIDVIDGSFTVELDFGSVFNGNERWLEIGIRPGEQNDPSVYTVLNPLVEIKAAPYALYALAGNEGPRGPQGDPGEPWLLNGTVAYYNAGNVGIGTDTPLAKLYVNGDIGLGSSNKYLIDTYSGLWWDSSNSRIALGSTAAVKLGLYSGSSTSRLVIDNISGNVGIGTADATTKLEVVDSGSSPVVQATNTNSGTKGCLATSNEGVSGEHTGNGTGVYGESFSSYGVHGHSSSGGGVHGSSTSGEGVSGSSDSSNGVEGHSTSGRGVFGTSGSSKGVEGHSTSGYGVSGFSTNGTGVYGHSANGLFAGAFEGDVWVTGNLELEGDVISPSDRRLKENITPLEHAIEKISLLDGVYFNFKGKSENDRKVGVIAQDVEKVLPELVVSNKEGYRSVDYAKLTPVLIEAVKELKAENDELKERLVAVEATINKSNKGDKQ